MGNITEAYKKSELTKQILVMIFAAVCLAVALNMFLIPADVFSAGINGISQLISSTLLRLFDINIGTGIWIFLLNIPIAVLGWIKLGRSSTILSLLTVMCVTIMTLIIPELTVTTNPLMNAITGGVLTGLAVGITMKYGFSTGGMDIVSLVLAKTTGRSVGSLMFTINIFIIAAAGFIFSWESALYTIISIFCTTQMVDKIHTSHQKVTAFIMTTKQEEVVLSVQNELVRGMTLMPGEGGFSRKDVAVIMIVITRYELYDLEQAVYNADDRAFINIVPTQTIYGQFWNQDDQKKIRDLRNQIP